MADKIIHNKIFQVIYMLCLFLLACVANIYGVEIYMAGAFVLVAAAMLVLSSRLTDAMLPVLLLSVFVTRLYNLLANETYKTQLFSIIWIAVPTVAAVVFHFIYYKKKFIIGRSFYGLCAISAALILGGVGTISAGEYFAPTALFYVFALGLGMVVFYMLIRPHLNADSGIEVAKIMYVVGLFAGFMVISAYAEFWDVTIMQRKFLSDSLFQCGNNISTFLMLAMPFPIYFAKKNPLHMISVVFMYTAIVFTGSRGGLLMGTAELFILFAAYVIFYPKSAKERIIAGCMTFVLAVAVICSIPTILKFSGIIADDGGESAFEFAQVIEKAKEYLFDKNQARFKLFDRMILDFKSNPIFGVGIGYTGNENIYNPVDGAMNWYHMWFAQVIGGLGILGILAYGYQLFDRLKLFFKNRNNLTLTLLLSYVGLFLMSQVNPGEFCPVPYSMLAVTFFAIMECRSEPENKIAEKI